MSGESKNSRATWMDCPVCLQPFETDDKNKRLPRNYPCLNGHTVCTECVPKMPQCPICRSAPVVDASVLRTNTALVQLMDAMQKDVSLSRSQSLSEKAVCSECQGPAHLFCPSCCMALCTKCSQRVHQNPASSIQHHVVQELPQSVESIAKCTEPNHKEPLNLFCTKCETPICVVCIHTAKHEGHKTMLITQATEKLSSELKRSVDEAKALVQQLHTYVLAASHVQEYERKCVEEAQDVVTAKFDECFKALNERKQTVLAQLQERGKRRRQDVDDTCGRLREAQTSVERVVAKASGCGTIAEIMRVKLSLEANLHAAQSLFQVHELSSTKKRSKLGGDASADHRSIDVMHVSACGPQAMASNVVRRFSIELKTNAKCIDIKRAVVSALGKSLRVSTLLVAEVYGHRLYKVYAADADISRINQPPDEIWVYDIPSLLENDVEVRQSKNKAAGQELKHENWITVQVHHKDRNQIEQLGWPLVIAVPESKIKAMAIPELRQVLRCAITPFLKDGWQHGEQDSDLYTVSLMNKAGTQTVLEIPFKDDTVIDLTTDTHLAGFSFALLWNMNAFHKRYWDGVAVKSVKTEPLPALGSAIAFPNVEALKTNMMQLGEITDRPAPWCPL